MISVLITILLAILFLAIVIYAVEAIPSIGPTPKRIIELCLVLLAAILLLRHYGLLPGWVR